MGTAAGSFIIIMVEAGITTTGVPGFWVRSVVGAVFLAAVVGYRILQGLGSGTARVRLLRSKFGSVDR